MIRSIAIIAPLLVGTAAVAQQGPSFDCARAEAGAEEIVCNDPNLAALDRSLAARYAEVLEAVAGYGGDAKAQEDRLRTEQRGWVSGRDDCWKAEDEKSCVEQAYLRRESELIARYMLQPPTATVAWTCNGNPADEVVTAFFNTPIDSVRIERGDTVDIGFIARSGSGARYEASFGRSIWIKGDDATYREADPDGTESSCRASQ